MAQTSRKRIEEDIADRILEILDRGDLPPWSKEWRDSACGSPCNALTMKPYRGINHWLTLLTQDAMGYQDPRWLTFLQAQQAGGSVTKGEKSTHIVFWKKITKENPEDPEELDTFQLLRYYSIFNLEQTHDCNFKPIETPELSDHDPIERAEQIRANMPNPPRFTTYQTSNNPPCYIPSADLVRVPEMGRFDRVEDYYTTVFHELTHSTGHPDRLHRFGTDANRDSLHEYGKEELVAGMGSAMLAGLAGIEAATLENDAAYINGWKNKIRADKSIVLKAAGQAQRAVDLITAHVPGDPAAAPDKELVTA